MQILNLFALRQPGDCQVFAAGALSREIPRVNAGLHPVASFQQLEAISAGKSVGGQKQLS